MRRIKDFDRFSLRESHDANTQWLESFMEEIESRNLPQEELSKTMEALDYLGGDGIMDMYGMMQFPWCVNAFLGDVDSILNKKYNQ
jgi:hypothetical protein